MKFKSLRSLSLQHLEIEELPSSIGELVHLRYLDLRRSENLKMLPASLCKLQNLLILRLYACLKLSSLPNDLQKLVSLRYLEIEGCDLDHTPSGLEEMTSLVMLDQLIVNKDDGGLRRLKQLNNLTGALRIDFDEGPWKNSVVDAEESMLSFKTKLSKLKISFCESREGEETVDADAVLDKLQPPNNLSDLSVCHFPGVKFPDWLSSLTNLVKLYLYGCISCVELPRLSLLCQLKELYLISMDRLEYVGYDISYDCGGGSFFPSLEQLYMLELPSIKGWWKHSEGEEVSYAGELRFARLTMLRLELCPQLTCLPGCPSLEYLTLRDVNVKLVTQLVPEAIQLEANNSKLDLESDEFKHVSDLRHLEISQCPNLKRHSIFVSLQYMPSLESLDFLGSSTEIEAYNDDKEVIPWMSLARLKSLGFEFGKDPQGAHLFKGLHHLTMLVTLSVYKKVPDDIDTQWTAPPNLKFFHIHAINEVGCLHRVLQQLKRLQDLYFWDCKFDEDEWDKLPWEDLKASKRLEFGSGNLKSLPERGRHLPAIEDIFAQNCDELTCLPTWVRRLTSLKIHYTHPELKDKCRKPLGSYWPLLQHIPHLNLL